MDFDNQPTNFYRYDGLGGLTDAELSPTDNALMGSLGYTTYLVRMKDESFLLVSARNRLEVREQISRITNPRQTIITPFNQNFVLEFKPKIRPIQHIRNGPIIGNENTPDFNFLDICMTKAYSDAQIACTNPEIQKKGRVVQIPAHCLILRRWDFFKRIIDKRNPKKGTKKKKKRGGGPGGANQNLLTIRDLKTFTKQNVEILLRYAYAPNLTPYEWIPKRKELDEFVKNTDLFFELLKLSKKVGMFSLYLRLCHFFLKERLKNCDLTLPVYTSDKNNPKYEEEKEHFKNVFFQKRFSINAKKILKVWDEVKGKGVKFIENYIAVYLIEHCVGHPARLKVLDIIDDEIEEDEKKKKKQKKKKDDDDDEEEDKEEKKKKKKEHKKEILEYSGIKYYLQKNDILLNLGRREFESPIERILKKKEEKIDRPKMIMMDDDDPDDIEPPQPQPQQQQDGDDDNNNIKNSYKRKKKLEFPYELSVCGDYNFESFLQFKKYLFPKVHEVEKEIVEELYQHRDEGKLKETKTNQVVATTIRNISYERKKKKELGRKMRKAWISEKESALETLRKEREKEKEEEVIQEEEEGEEEEDDEKKKEDDDDDDDDKKKKIIKTKMKVYKKSIEKEDNNYLDEEYLDVLGNEDLMKLQMKSNRFLLPRSEYKDAEDDSDSESEEEEEQSENEGEERKGKTIDTISSRKCAAKSCQKIGSKICTRCRQFFYCSRECQVKDWKFHKKICGK